MHVAKSTVLIVWATLIFGAKGWCHDRVLMHLNFDDSQDTSFEYGERRHRLATRDTVSGTSFRIVGLAEYTPGVSGTALKFDGFSSYVEGRPLISSEDEEEEEEFEIPRAISVEAWIALGAYPWNWAPILTIGKYKVTGFYFGVDSHGRLGFHVSDATSVWHECNSKADPKTKLGMDLRKWYHVVGTYSPDSGLAVYIDGERAGTYNDFQFDYGIVYSDIERGFRVGMNREDLAPSEPIRDWATYPSRYTFDGIIDEIKLHGQAFTAKQVKRICEAVRPENEPDLPARRFFTVRPSGRFGANYTRLSYYPQWDAIWPGGDHLDVVVQFDDYPTKVVFWRGTRYSPCWVSENGKWLADQSRETGNNWFLSEGRREDLPTGCIEHMSDTQCRSSRVAIIENNDARVVVNWRYLQMDVKFRQHDVPNNTGFGQWGNELYYIYPDGLGVRKVLPGYGGWQETIFLNEPGTRPEDNVELQACTLVNLAGESKAYSWAHGYPEFDLEGACIQMVNFKSKFKPFIIFRDGGGFDVFNLEVRPAYSHFPWWNHWPVAQTISDGRSCNAPDRASHSSLSWADPDGDVALYGMTDQPAEFLVDLARSWNYPAELEIEGSAFASEGYDHAQRAYVLRAEEETTSVRLKFAASARSPLFNLALVVKRWGPQSVALTVDGRPVPRGKVFRYGVEYDVEGNPSFVAWMKIRAEGDTEISLDAH
ncbi:MAG: LamG domain-containing protein [Phycisphaerales bacterium]|nr:MAG: LamG domain-containing protein [Phycisphaerales bacterium]